jgi:Uma2 family endonuclease
MNVQAKPADQPGRMTADEFLAWAAGQPGRHELVDGEVFGMAAERSTHTFVKGEAAFALRQAIKARGLDCQTFVDGTSVRIDEATVYEPDALVRCGPRLPDDPILIPDPLILVEVLSPSTRAVDTGKKLTGYFALPSLRHYLVLDPADRTVIHYRRGGEGGPDDPIEMRILHAPPPTEGTAPQGGSELILDPPGLTIPCEHLFEAP